MAETAEKLDQNGNPESWNSWLRGWGDYAVLKANNFADAANAAQAVILTNPAHAAAIIAEGAVKGAIKSVPGLVALGADGVDYLGQKVGIDILEGSAVARTDKWIDDKVEAAQYLTGLQVKADGQGDQALLAVSSFVGGIAGGMGATKLVGMGAGAVATAFRTSAPAVDTVAAGMASASAPITGAGLTATGIGSNAARSGIQAFEQAAMAGGNTVDSVALGMSSASAPITTPVVTSVVASAENAANMTAKMASSTASTAAPSATANAAPVIDRVGDMFMASSQEAREAAKAAASASAPEGAASFTAGTSGMGGGSGTAGSGIGGGAGAGGSAAGVTSKQLTFAQTYKIMKDPTIPMGEKLARLIEGGRLAQAERLAKSTIANNVTTGQATSSIGNARLLATSEGKALANALDASWQLRNSGLKELPGRLAHEFSSSASYLGNTLPYLSQNGKYAAYSAGRTLGTTALSTTVKAVPFAVKQTVLHPIRTSMVVGGAAYLDHKVTGGAVTGLATSAFTPVAHGAGALAQKGLETAAPHLPGSLGALTALAAGGDGNWGEASGKAINSLFEGAANNWLPVAMGIAGGLMGGINGRLLPALLLGIVFAGIGMAIQGNKAGIQDDLKSGFNKLTNAIGLGELGQQTIAANPKTIRPPVMAMAPG